MRSLSVLFLFVILICGCFKKGEEKYIKNVSKVEGISSSGEKGEGAAVPNFYWYDKSGNRLSFKEYTNGKVAIVFFWSTLCKHCKPTFATLRAVNKTYADKGVVLIGVSTFEKADLSYRLNYISKFVEERDFGYQVLMDTDDKVMWAAFGMDKHATPTTVMINKNGRIVKAMTGSLTEEGFAEEIEKVLQ